MSPVGSPWLFEVVRDKNESPNRVGNPFGKTDPADNKPSGLPFER